MGQVFRDIEPYLGDMSKSIFLEIGSDRYEGSTEYIDNLARKYSTEFHSVDVIPHAKRRLPHLATHWHIKNGSDWCKDDLPLLDKTVGFVYLDNFDYDWSVIGGHDDEFRKQQSFYSEKLGIKMTNQNCQVEHMKQMVYIFPFLSDDAVVAFDDTYTLNDCWVGKCGPVVVWLLAKGFDIVQNIKSPKDVGVILKRK